MDASRSTGRIFFGVNKITDTSLRCQELIIAVVAPGTAEDFAPHGERSSWPLFPCSSEDEVKRYSGEAMGGSRFLEGYHRRSVSDVHADISTNRFPLRRGPFASAESILLFRMPVVDTSEGK